MINTNFKLYLNNWQLFYVATDLVTVLAFEVKLQSLYQFFFVFVWVFVDVFTVNDFLYFIFQQIYCLNILRMPFKIKRKKSEMPCKCKAVQRILYIVVQSLVYFYQLLVYLVYSGNSTKTYEVFLNYIQFYVMIFYTYTYVYIHSISTLYWNLCSGLFLGITKCDHL